MRIISILLTIVVLIVGLLGCSSSTTEYTLTIYSTDGGDGSCVPSIGCTCGEGTESSGGLPVPEECVCAEGTEVSIVATPDPDYRFIGWTGDVETIADFNAATTTITMNGDYSITANFVPYGAELIWDWYDLDAIRDSMGGYYILMNDLNPSTPGYQALASPTANNGTGWHPIGNFDGITFTSFNGTLDGQGFRIHDLYINYSEEFGGGLFGCVGKEGSIRNIGVANASITHSFVGGLVLINCGTLRNCYSSGNLTGEYMVGGLVCINGGAFVGTEEGTIVDCYSYTNVIVHQMGSWDDGAGGLVGLNGGPVINSYSTGTVTGGGSAGGLVGGNGANISSSYSTSSVIGCSRVGGLAGLNINHHTVISNSYSTSCVTGNSSVGGLVGENHWGTVTNCYATGTVTSSSGENTDFGGFVGLNWQGKIINCYSTGSVHQEGTADPIDKGFAGNVDTGGDYEMTGNFWNTQTSGQTSTAGDATGKTTAEMEDITTFSGASWDIVEVGNSGLRNTGYIWNIVDNETYPFLSWQPVT